MCPCRAPQRAMSSMEIVAELESIEKKAPPTDHPSALVPEIPVHWYAGRDLPPAPSVLWSTREYPAPTSPQRLCSLRRAGGLPASAVHHSPFALHSALGRTGLNSQALGAEHDPAAHQLGEFQFLSVTVLLARSPSTSVRSHRQPSLWPVGGRPCRFTAKRSRVSVDGKARPNVCALLQ